MNIFLLSFPILVYFISFNSISTFWSYLKIKLSSKRTVAELFNPFFSAIRGFIAFQNVLVGKKT